MIPAAYDAQTSNAERRVFERLRSDPDTREWTVLHSLALSRRDRKPYGEIDFVVLAPEGGILCLEVKGGGVSCADGIWRTQNVHGRISELTRSPFQQAREGMFALRTAIRNHFGEHDPLFTTTIGSAVLFPDVDAPPLTTEYESWECIDIRRFRQPISRLLKEVLRHQRERVGGVPLGENARRLRSFLRPDFDVVVARATTISRSEDRLIRLTEEQFEVLDSVEQNVRCFVEGAAGTGKTLLGLEYGRRAAAQGRRVLILCFNRTLGDWFTQQVKSDVSLQGVQAGSYHRLLRDIIVSSSYRDEFLRRERDDDRRSLFGEAYSFYGELALAEQEALPELLIVDEAQDLVSSGALPVLNAWTSGGLAGGRWAIFGDMTRQAIYKPVLPEADAPLLEAGDNVAAEFNNGKDRIRVLLREYAEHFTTLVLRRNCRNTKPIGEETALLSGFDALPYRLDSQEGLAVDYRWCRDNKAAAGTLRDVLVQLKRDGVPASEIVVLSPVRYDKSAAAKLENDQDHPVQPLVEKGRGRAKSVRFSTIHSFKGMESSVVVLCDIEHLAGTDAQSILYVGMSRARSHLVVLLHDDLRVSLQTAVRKRLTEGWAT